METVADFILYIFLGSKITVDGDCSHSFWRFFSLLISSSILGTYRPGELIFQCPIFLPFHTVHGGSQVRTPEVVCQWTTFCQDSPPRRVFPGPTLRGSHGPCDQIGYFSVIVIISLMEKGKRLMEAS